MAASTGVLGFGTLLEYCATENGSYTIIAEVAKVNPPKKKMGKADITNHDSVTNSNGHKEFIPGGLSEYDDVSCTIIYNKTQHHTLLATLYGVKYWYKIVYVDGSYEKLQGWISEIGNTVELENKAVETEVSITVTGEMSFTAGS